MELPTVLVYKLAPVTWFLAKHLVHVKYAGLPNLLLNREVTPELLQDAVTPEHIVEIAGAWITDETKRQQNIQELKEVRSKLGDSGAVRRTGELILNTARIGKE